MCSSCKLLSYPDIPCQRSKAKMRKKRWALEISLEVTVNI